MESSDKIRASVSSIRTNMNKELDRFSELIIGRMESLESTTALYPISEYNPHFVSRISYNIYDDHSSWTTHKMIRISFGFIDPYDKSDKLHMGAAIVIADDLKSKGRVDSYSNNSVDFLITEDEAKLGEILKSIDALGHLDSLIIEKNTEINKRNKDLWKRMEDIFGQLGIPLTAYTAIRKNKSELRTVPYIADMKTKFNLNYSYSMKSVDELKDRIRDSWNKVSSDIRMKRIEKERKELADKTQRENDIKLGKFIAKYIPDSTDGTYSDVLYAILAKDINLELAAEMVAVRGDFNRGTRGIQRIIDRHTDSRIIAAISSAIQNWDGDGRQFRDCEYSYDALFALCSPELVVDYNEVSSICGQ